MRTVKIFCPAHITGLFTVEERSNPLFKGSRGVGVTLSNGVHTEVKVEPSSTWKIRVRSLGARIRGEVSRRVVELLKGRMPQPFHIEIVHRFDVPVGSGYGASGAGALGVAIGLNEALGLGLSWSEAAAFAHLAETQCGTGLGSVLAEYHGGLGFRVRAGAPGIGLVKKINSEGLWVASACWGPIPTKKLLLNCEALNRIRRVGEKLLRVFQARPSAETFLNLSKTFTSRLGVES